MKRLYVVAFFVVMLNGLLGKKLDQTQAFLEDGRRIPLSLISVSGNWVTQIKTPEKDLYSAVQLGFGHKKKTTKAIAGHSKKAGQDKKTPRFFREVRTDDITGIELGQEINIAEILEPGDVIDVTGTSKGKGYAGVVKRHHFKGGPKTHGQSDRHRAPGASGQGTTPGRVYKGKRMSGRMGNERVTVKNLTVIDIKDSVIYVKGLIPGVKGSLVMISKARDDKRSAATKKKFMPLFSVKEEVAEPVVEEVVVEALPENPEELHAEAQATSENSESSDKTEKPVKSEKSEDQKEEVKENA